jgi:hypothetical protein
MLHFYKLIEYSLCSLSQWPSGNAGCMNIPSYIMPIRFITFSEGIFAMAVKE